MLDIDMEFKRGILIVRLKGVLNSDTVNKLKNNLQTTIKDNGIKYVLLNLTKLLFVDNYGLESIKQNYKEIVNNKGKLMICGTNKLLNYNIELTENLYQVGEEKTAYEIVNI